MRGRTHGKHVGGSVPTDAMGAVRAFFNQSRFGGEKTPIQVAEMWLAEVVVDPVKRVALDVEAPF